MRKYKHLSQEERIQISTCLNLQKSKSEIARLLNRPQCTISRELKRNSGSTYRWDIAHELATSAQRIKHKGSKIGKSELLYRYIRFCLHFRMSPEQISNKLRTK
jgi:IS30 family transposase